MPLRIQDDGELLLFNRTEEISRARRGTGVGGGDGGGAAEVAGGAPGLVALVVAVGGPGAVRGDGVGVVAPAALQDGRAVGAALRTAREVDRLLQHRRRLVRTAHAEICRRRRCCPAGKRNTRHQQSSHHISIRDA